MSKDREAFYRICQHCTSNPFDEEYYTITDDMPEEVEIVEQALIKAEEEHSVLEIIKEKRVNVDMLMTVKDVNIYNGFACNSGEYRRLTQEEFDLLKETFIGE